MGGVVTLVGGVDEPDKHSGEVVDFGCVVGLILLEGRSTFSSAVLESSNVVVVGFLSGPCIRRTSTAWLAFSPSSSCALLV